MRVLESSRAQRITLLRRLILLLRGGLIPLVEILSIRLRIPIRALTCRCLLLGFLSRRSRRLRFCRRSRSRLRCRRTLHHLWRSNILRHPRFGNRCTIHVSYHSEAHNSGKLRPPESKTTSSPRTSPHLSFDLQFVPPPEPAPPLPSTSVRETPPPCTGRTQPCAPEPRSAPCRRASCSAKAVRISASGCVPDWIIGFISRCLPRLLADLFVSDSNAPVRRLALRFGSEGTCSVNESERRMLQQFFQVHSEFQIPRICPQRLLRCSAAQSTTSRASSAVPCEPLPRPLQPSAYRCLVDPKQSADLRQRPLIEIIGREHESFFRRLAAQSALRSHCAVSTMNRPIRLR